MSATVAFLRRFVKDRHGIAAIEFALILPVMLIMMTGIVEMSNLMMAERRMSSAAHATADLISQETDLTTTDLDEIFQAAALVVDPFDDTNLTLGVASVRFDETTGDPTEDWTGNYNGGTVANSTTVATGMGDAGGSVIIVTATFSYTPILNAVISGTFTLSETAVTRPRYIDYVGLY